MDGVNLLEICEADFVEQDGALGTHSVQTVDDCAWVHLRIEYIICYIHTSITDISIN